MILDYQHKTRHPRANVWSRLKHFKLLQTWAKCNLIPAALEAGEAALGNCNWKEGGDWRLGRG